MNFNTSGTHAVKLTAKPSDTCRICNVYFKIAVGDFGKKNKYISPENLFKIPERAGVASIPPADLFKAHRSWSWSGSTRWESFTSLQKRLRGKPRSATFQALCVCCFAPENCQKKVVRTVRHLLQSSPKRRKTAVCRLPNVRWFSTIRPPSQKEKR